MCCVCVWLLQRFSFGRVTFSRDLPLIFEFQLVFFIYKLYNKKYTTSTQREDNYYRYICIIHIYIDGNSRLVSTPCKRYPSVISVADKRTKLPVSTQHYQRRSESKLQIVIIIAHTSYRTPRLLYNPYVSIYYVVYSTTTVNGFHFEETFH